MKALFKSATAYRLVEPDALHDLSLLDERPVEECAPGQLSRVGWENPYDSDSDVKVYQVDDFEILCLVTVQKVIKPTSITRELTKRIKEIEKEERRGVGRKERLELKDAIIHAALPAALSEEKRIYAYIDWGANMLVIDQHSANKCDYFTKCLRDQLGSLPIEPLRAAKVPDMVMKSWITDNTAPPRVELQGDALFKNPTDLSQTARVCHLGLDGAGVAGLIKDGMVPQEVGLSWQLTDTSHIDFKLADTVTLKSIKFSDELINSDDGYDDAEQGYQSAMIINCSTITQVIQECFELFGGMTE